MKKTLLLTALFCAAFFPLSSAFSRNISSTTVADCSPKIPREDAAILVFLIHCRLSLAYDSARAKYNAGTPQNEREHDTLVINTALKVGELTGLSASVTRVFWVAQIAATRTLERELIVAWKKQGHAKFTDAPTLATVWRREASFTGRITSVYSRVWRMGTAEERGSLTCLSSFAAEEGRTLAAARRFDGLVTPIDYLNVYRGAIAPALSYQRC